MAQYVISDIHGEADRFHEMLRTIQFCESDTLYILGDVVDRGPNGISLLREIMEAPNITMLLGNHEYMMLQYMSPEATEVEIRRWNRNGNAPTLKEFEQLDTDFQTEILEFLKELPTHMEIELPAKCSKFYLVHGFYGENVHDEVWNRPTPDTPSPLPGYCLIVGHTPIRSLLFPKEEREVLTDAMAERGEHLKIFHGDGFIDIDCGCGHSYPIKALACLRLDDMAEFYV